MGSATVTAAPGGSEDAGAVERVVQEAEAIETARVDGSLRAGIKKVKKKVGAVTPRPLPASRHTVSIGFDECILFHPRAPGGAGQGEGGRR